MNALLPVGFNAQLTELSERLPVILDVVERAVLVTPATVARLYAPPHAVPSGEMDPMNQRLDVYVREAVGDAYHDMQKVDRILRWCAGLSKRAATAAHTPAPPVPAAVFSRVETPALIEELIAAGASGDAELSLVLRALLRAAGFHARLVFLGRAQPPALHTVVEVYAGPRGPRWTLCDPSNGKTYTWMKHGFANAWDIRQLPQLIDKRSDHATDPFVNSAWFHTIAIETG